MTFAKTSFDKTLYIITNLAGICAVSGVVGAISYSHNNPVTRKISENFMTLAVASTFVLLTSPFISNLADVVL